jgi:hypothetical protein
VQIGYTLMSERHGRELVDSASASSRLDSSSASRPDCVYPPGSEANVCRAEWSGIFGRMAKKRELIEPNPGDKRYVRRDAGGKFGDNDDVSKSLAKDVRTRAKTEVKPGHGDEGDRPLGQKSNS